LKDALQEALRGAVGPELGAAYEAERGLAVTVDLRHPAGDSGILEFFRQLPAHLHARAAPLATVEEVSINIIKDTLGCMKVAEFRQFSPLTPQTWGVSGDITWELRLSHEPIYLMGRYCKWHRKLAQTPWVLNGRRLLEDSVQELIGLPVLPLLYPTVDLTDPALREPAPVDTEASAKRAKLEADSLGCHAKGKAFNTYCTAPVEALYKFHACGREDVDVRMLGTGRPFVIEATNPHVTTFSEEDFARMMAVVAADPEERVTIHELRLGSLAEFDTLNAHVDRRRKGYRCVVWAARDLSRSPELVEAINRCTELVLAQMTPIRVMHRRSLLTRKKVIHSITCEVISAHWLVVDVVTSAGTYVKEFVHGDCGRTVPSLASMLQCRTEIIQLDVTEVL
jgi:tRNA pseudouridine synthase 10